MANELEIEGHITITSYKRGRPHIGVHHGHSALQFVSAGAPVIKWKSHKVGKDRYRLSIGGYGYIGVDDRFNVVASVSPENESEWEIIYHPPQKAYTIAMADKRYFGWTMPVDDRKHEILIRPIDARPYFLSRQLFILEHQNEDDK